MEIQEQINDLMSNKELDFPEVQQEIFILIKKLTKTEVKNFVSNKGKSLLSYAAQRNFKNIVEYLIDNKADINFIDSTEDTAINVAARAGHKEIVEYLFSKGALLNIENNGYCRAMYLAVAHGELECIKTLEKFGVSLNFPDDKNLIMKALDNGHAEVFYYLKDKGLNWIKILYKGLDYLINLYKNTLEMLLI